MANWWVGLLLGIPLAIAARLGPCPKLTARDLVRPVGLLLVVMPGSASIAGLAGLLAAHMGWVYLVGELAISIPAARQTPFLVALWMHTASYALGFLGGAFLCLHIWRRRQTLA